MKKIVVEDMNEEIQLHCKNVNGRLWITSFNGCDWYTVGKYCHHQYAYGECAYCRLVIEDEDNDYGGLDCND